MEENSNDAELRTLLVAHNKPEVDQIDQNDEEQSQPLKLDPTAIHHVAECKYLVTTCELQTHITALAYRFNKMLFND